MTARIHVPGTPQPQGSMRSFRSPKTGNVMTLHSNKSLHPWRNNVAAAAAEAWGGPVSSHGFEVSLTFSFGRPKSHYRTGRFRDELRPWANDTPHTTAPDVDKLVRAVLDALTGIVWRDDGQVVRIEATKRYGTPGLAAEVREVQDDAL